MSTSIVGGYIPARRTINAAARNNQSVTEYLEMLWKAQGSHSRTVENFQRFGALNPATKHVCEIGTGAGLIAESVLKYSDDLHYESYELDKEWADWLSRTFKIVSHPTPGDRLDSTPSNSIDLVHANGVFVYTPFLVTIKYFCEMFRVTKSGGYAVFDIFSERCFHGEALKYWLNSGETFPRILPEAYVKQFFLANGFAFVGEFFVKGTVDPWHYLVFRKQNTLNEISLR